MGRYNIQGLKDYTGISLEEIINDLKEWLCSTREVIQELKELRKEIMVNLKRIDNVDSIVGYIDYFIDLFKGYEGDFKRILDEMGFGIEERHLEIINQIFESSSNEERYHNREFKNEHIVKKLKDESMRPLIDEIYSLTGNQLLRNINLWGLCNRLRTFVGIKVNKETISNKILEAIELKPNIQGIGINLNYIIKHIFGWLKKKE